MVSKRRAISVLAFSIQSLRRSFSRALSFAIASFVRALRYEPRLAREPLLERLQPLRLTRGEARGAQQFAGRQYRRRRNTTVDTDHAPIVGASDRVGDVGKRHVPAACAITGDPIGLHSPWDRPRQPKAHPADLGHPHLTQPAIQILNVMRFNADLPKPFMPSPSAPRRAAVRSSKKVAHRLGEVPQRLLLHGLRASRQPIVVGAGRGQLGAPLGVARRATAWLPMLLLLNGQVPDKPGMTAMLVQHGSLLGARKQPVSRHARTITASTDKTPKGETASPPGLGFHAVSTNDRKSCIA
jgi:hypothetical protein